MYGYMAAANIAKMMGLKIIFADVDLDTFCISLKTIKLGGIVEVLNCAFLASNNGIAINLAGKVAETSISSYAIANIATSIPQMNWDLSITNQYLIEDPVLVPLDIHNGKVHMTETIGLGTEIDMNKAKKYITSN